MCWTGLMSPGATAAPMPPGPTSCFLEGKDELAKKYLQLYSRKSGTALQYIQQWMPIVAASQSVKGNAEEREFLMRWVDVVEWV